MRRMKHILVLLLMAVSCFVAPVVAEEESGMTAAELREARKEAKDYIKRELTRNKKLAGYLKKVKDAKSAKKQGKEILKYLDNNVGQKTALGVVGEEKRPDNAAMDEEMAKKQKQIDASYDAIVKEMERIGELDIDGGSEFEQAIDKINELLP